MSSKIKLYAIQLSYEIPSEEKDKAIKIINYLDFLLKQIKYCDDHLDLIYIPFKDSQEIPPDQIFKVRAALRRYRDKVAENFNNLKIYAFKIFALMQFFASDTQMSKLIKSFVIAIEDIEKQVNRFLDIFSNLDTKDFSKNVVKGAESIKKELAEIKQILEDRIKNHIETNILARNWVDNISKELQKKVEDKIPLSVSLVNDRNEKLNNTHN